MVVTIDSKFKNNISENWKKTDSTESYYSTTNLNILVSLVCSHNFFQINNPKYADTKETGTKIGKMNFHNSCSNISTLWKVIRFIPKNDLNIFTDHGKYIVTKKNEMATENIIRVWSLELTNTFLLFRVNIERTSSDTGMSMFRRYRGNRLMK